MNVRELLTKLGFEVDHKPLDHVEEKLEGIKKRLEFLAAAEVARGLYELAEKFADMGEKLAVAAQSAGITVEAFQKLAFAAQQSAVGQEEMETAMARLSRRLYDAKHGSQEASKAFRAVGISGDQVRGFKTSQEAMEALADQFKNIQDPIKKAALAQELMGRGSIHMVGFLSKGSAAIRAQGDEAEKLGLILGGSQVEALEKLELSFHKIFALLKAIGGFIASYIAPVLSLMVDDFIKWFGVNKDIIGLNIKNFLNAFAYGLGFVWGGVKLLIDSLIDLSKRFGLSGQILPLVAKFAGLVGMILTVIKVARILGVVWAIIASPIFLVAAAIAAVVVAVHDLVALWKGNDTWLGPLIKGAGGAASEAFGKAKDFLGFTSGVNDKANGLASPGAALSTISNSQSTTVGDTSNSVSAPVTINVPPGSDPKEVGTKVREGIRDHLDRVRRENQRSTLSPVAY